MTSASVIFGKSPSSPDADELRADRRLCCAQPAGQSGCGVRLFRDLCEAGAGSLAGGAWPEPARFPLRAAFAQTKKAGRREFWRARLALMMGTSSSPSFPVTDRD